MFKRLISWLVGLFRREPVVEPVVAPPVVSTPVVQIPRVSDRNLTLRMVRDGRVGNDTYQRQRTRALYSCRTRGKGGLFADGRYASPFAIRLMELSRGK